MILEIIHLKNIITCLFAALSIRVIFSTSVNKINNLTVSAPHPVRHDGANPTRTGCPLALGREIPLLAFVGRIPRTGFAGCCGRPLRVALLRTSCLLLKRLDGGSPTALVIGFAE